VNAPTPIVHIYVLLDRSGSMSAMVEQVVAGFNRLLSEQQADGQDAHMTLVQFDDEDHREVLFEAVPIAEVLPLTARDFVPRGMTRCSTPPAASSAERHSGRSSSPRLANDRNRC
jgi:uncharacterized protein YegL